jgi:hypothetical protein
MDPEGRGATSRIGHLLALRARRLRGLGGQGAGSLRGLLAQRTLGVSATALVAFVVLGVHVASCSFVQDGSAFDNGVCDDGWKPCGTSCELISNPSFGCTQSSCQPCDLANATAFCDDAGGGCEILQCQNSQEFWNCNDSGIDGCETDLMHDPQNCGMCGCRCGSGDSTYCLPSQQVTPIANGEPGCREGACTVRSCTLGWGDCDGILANGCETPTDGGGACGACGTVCTDPFTCVCTVDDAGPHCGCEAPDGATP